jgi:hypothetical protein
VAGATRVSAPRSLAGLRADPGNFRHGDERRYTRQPGGLTLLPVSEASKYAPLARLLARGHSEVVEMTFTEVDEVVSGGLPESAYRYRTWWTVSVGNSAQSRHGWIGAGYRVSAVDLDRRLVTFTKCADGLASERTLRASLRRRAV